MNSLESEFQNRASHRRLMAMVPLFTALIIIGAWVQVPFPGIPFSLQSFVTLLAGFLLPRFYALMSVGIYLAIGAIGFPVFAKGAGGLAAFAGPTGGFLFGFLIQVFLQGYFKSFQAIQRADPFTRMNLLVGGSIGTLGLFVAGSIGLFFHLWLGSQFQAPVWPLFLRVGKALAPFLLPAFLKLAASVWVTEELVSRMSPSQKETLFSSSNQGF